MPIYSKLTRLIGLMAAWLALTTGYAQTTLTNPSFEGTPGAARTPSGWTICGGSPDILPSVFGVTLPASNGSTYAGCVADNSGYRESFGQPFTFTAGTTYTFSIDLAYSTSVSYWSNPGQLKVWAGSSSCTSTLLIWTSPVVAHTSWQTYTFSFTPTSAYTYLKFESAVGPSARSNVLMDKLLNDCFSTPLTIVPSAALAAANNQWPLDSTINLTTAYTPSVPASVVRWKIKYENRPGAEAIPDPSAYEFEQTGVVTLTPTAYCTNGSVAFTPASVQLTITGGFDQEIEVKWPMIWEDTWPEYTDDRPVVCEVKILKANGRLLFAGKTNVFGKLLVKGISPGDKLLVEQVAFPDLAVAEVDVTQSATNSTPLIINLSPMFK